RRSRDMVSVRLQSLHGSQADPMTTTHHSLPVVPCDRFQNRPRGKVKSLPFKDPQWSISHYGRGSFNELRVFFHCSHPNVESGSIVWKGVQGTVDPFAFHCVGQINWGLNLVSVVLQNAACSVHLFLYVRGQRIA